MAPSPCRSPLLATLVAFLFAARALAQLPDQPPQAVAGSDRDGATGTTVVLDGRGSFDPDGQPLAYRWTFAAIPVGSRAILFGPDTVLASFTPDVAGDFFVQLTVTTATGTGVDAVRIRVTGAAAVTTPVARIRAPAQALPGDRVELDGQTSESPSGARLAYRWKQTFGQPVQLAGATSARASFRPLNPGFATLELRVDDGVRASLPATATVIVANAPPRAPVADAGGDKTGTAGSAVRLAGRVLAPRGLASVTVRWTYEGGPVAVLAISAPANAVASFVPASGGDYAFKLSADDGQTKDEDRIVVRVAAAPDAAGTSEGSCAMPGGLKLGLLDLAVAGLPLLFLGIRRRRLETADPVSGA